MGNVHTRREKVLCFDRLKFGSCLRENLQGVAMLKTNRICRRKEEGRGGNGMVATIVISPESEKGGSQRL